MNTFKKKSLCTALAGLGTLGLAGAADAVNVNPNGLGQVLIYPYYTVRADSGGNAFNSLLSVVNSTGSVKAVKVRFLEGKDSQEVLDFNLFLSPFDVWTTAIVPSGAGGGITTADKSCTLPPVVGTVNFVNYQYTGSNDDGGGGSLDRTKEGYVEIIEMATYDSSSTTAKNVTHVNGVPPGCAKVNDTTAGNEALSPGGGLFGAITLINVNEGQSFTQNATSLDNYSFIPIYFPAGQIGPTLAQPAPPVSTVVANYTGTLSFVVSTWNPATADPVSAVLMEDQVLNEYVIDAGIAANTDWVITMPTKRYYVAPSAKASPAALGLFESNFIKGQGSCDDVSLAIYDREENTASTPVSFSPPPPTQTNALCWEANVISFNGNGTTSNVFQSVNVANINPLSIGSSFSSGWLDLTFPIPSGSTNVHLLGNGNTTITPVGGTTSGVTTATYFGLPVVGFAANSYTNNSVTVGTVTVQSNYGGDFGHRYVTTVTP
jgi:hypothetical protein